MRLKFNKEIEFFFKRILFSEKFLLRNRLKRAIKKNYEEELLILDKIVNKDLESIDIGVYRGVYSYKLSKLSKHVHSFEPNKLIYPYLNKNLTKIINNITLYNIALSDKNGHAVLKIPKRYNTINKKNYEERYKLGAATIHSNNKLLNDDFITVDVKVARLDDIILNRKIGFIKIDVEGHEKNVLKGAINIIKKNKPNLLVEIEERHTKENVDETINFINNFGYKSFYYEESKLVNTNNLKNLKLKNNYIFLPH